MTGHDIELIALGTICGVLGLLTLQWGYNEISWLLSQREKQQKFFRMVEGKLIEKEAPIKGPLVPVESFEDEDVVS